MWQRIQTLYYGIAVLGLVILLTGDVFEGVRYVEKLPYAVLLGLGAACNAVSLFAFKKRSLQIRLTGVAIVVILGLQIWLAVDYFRLPEAVFKWTAVLPLVITWLDVMAVRGVLADELVVKSSSRLRPSKTARKK